MKNMKPLRLFYIYKGQQSVDIGDNIKSMLGDYDDSAYDVLDWNLDFEIVKQTIDQIRLDLRCREIHDDGKKMINSNLYITNSSGIILGIFPINHKDKQKDSTSTVIRPKTVRLDEKEEVIVCPTEKLNQLIDDYSYPNIFDGKYIVLGNKLRVNPSNDFIDGLKEGMTQMLRIFKIMVDEYKKEK